MYYVILDTETTNSIDDPLMYDIGFSVINEKAEIYESHSFVVKEIFENEELMASAYFVDKIPQYLKEIENGTRKVKTLSQIYFALRKVMEKYHTPYVIAHNIRFDYLATCTTQRYLTKSKYRYFFKYGTQFIDTLKMSREVFGKDEQYLEFCKVNGYVTNYQKPRFTAEILYRYISGDNEFVESHTGFEDTEIEKIIFAECLRRNPNVDGLLW